MNVIPKLKSCRLTGGTVDLRMFNGLRMRKPAEWSGKGADRDLQALADDILFSKYRPIGEEKIDVVTEPSLPSEGYRIIIGASTILIAAADTAGALYAMETLRVAAMLDAKEPVFQLECAEITDAPRFGWRGISLDEARHFFGKSAVKRLMDLMAMHKLNRFHWHLSDDQGWRLEIKQYPLLTEIGSKREKTNIHGWSSTDDDGTPHSGFYTHDDVKEIVRYAAERNIEIVPEFDMPAHFAAAFAAYPDLACRNIPAEVQWFFGGKYPASIGWKDWNRTACVGKEKTMQFVRNVIDEVAELFPAPYFHIGGDEAPKDEWKECPDCQRVIKEKGLKDEKALQGWFTNEVSEYVKTKGKSLIGWNEVLEGGNLDRSVIVQYWTAYKDLRVTKHLSSGGNVVMSNHKCFYFDMSYCQYPLKNTYMFKPNMAGVRKKQIPQVLGVEGEVWTEWIADMNKVELQLFPRMEALAEVAWSDGKKNWKAFLERLDEFLPILDGLNINYAEKAIANPAGAKHRQKIIHLWYGGCDQDWELRENAKLKAAKNKK